MNDKKNHMEKLDKSKKGSVDKKILKLVNIINSKDGLFTTSSCAGRIRLLSFGPNAKKNQVTWNFVSHEIVTFDEIKKVLANVKINKGEEIWIMQEAAILHVSAESIELAQKIVNIARSVGFKRTGLQSFEKRYILELVNNDHLEMPIGHFNKLYIDDDYLKFVLNISNRRLKRNFEKIKKLEKELILI